MIRRDSRCTVVDPRAELLIETLPGYLQGDIILQPQDDSLATRAPMLQKEDGKLNFELPALALERKYGRLTPGLEATPIWKTRSLKYTGAYHPFEGRNLERDMWSGDGRHLNCNGLLVLDEVQPAGKKAMAGDRFLRGARNWSES